MPLHHPSRSRVPRAVIIRPHAVRDLAIRAAGTAALALAAPLGAQRPAPPAPRPAAPAPVVALARATALTPYRRGNRIFVGTATGGVYVSDRGGPFHLVLPASSVPYTVVAPSPRGRYIAYGLAAPGVASRTYDVHVRDLQTGTDLPTVLHHAAISTKPWTLDERGLFYTRADSGGARERVAYHHLREPQGRDAVVLSDLAHPEFRYRAEVSDDGQYAVFTISHPQDAKTALAFIDVQDPGNPKLDAPVVRLVQNFASRYRFVDDAGIYFILQTDRAAPRGKLVLADINVSREGDWRTIVPEQTDSLVVARTAGDQYVAAVYRPAAGGADRIQVFGPPDPRVTRAVLRARLDSLRKARRERERQGGPPPISEPMLGPMTLQLQDRAALALPPGATVLGIHSVADQPDLFYTVRLPDGRVHAYRYDVKTDIPTLFAPTLAPPPAPTAR